MQETSTFRSRSFSVASIAQASIARDLEISFDYDEAERSHFQHDISESGHQLGQHSLAESYRRPSFAFAGNRLAFTPSTDIPVRLSQREQDDVLQQERSLLHDSEVMAQAQTSTKDLNGRRHSLWSKTVLGTSRRGSTLSSPQHSGNSTENDPLLGDNDSSADMRDTYTVAKTWEEAVTTGSIHTSWQRETKVLAGYCAPLMATFLLQYSLTMASIFTVGRIGATELGAVSLASMSANISGYAIYQGLSVSLDTLCAQAYGSGKKSLVGLQMQRMILLLWLITIPIGIVWILSDKILLRLVPEPDVAILAGRYLRILLLGAPGYACFEAGKRFVQAQGMFTASLYVLCVCAPLNALMNWLFVWQFGFGFVGAPIAVAITDTLLPIGLYVYVRFFSDDGMSCWGGFSVQALCNWMPMIRLAIPGLTMIEAEVLASEILTLMSSYFGVKYLAAQSVLATVTALAFQIPFPLSVAASTRVANLIGATLGDAARVSAKVALWGAVLVGGVNAALLAVLRWYIPRLFSKDEEVIALVANVLPVCAAFQLFDALAACENGVLRGLGRQEIGAYTQLVCYYAVGIPISIATAFALKWHLYGLWTGNAIALASVTFVEAALLSRISWERAVEDAKRRNELG